MSAAHTPTPWRVDANGLAIIANNNDYISEVFAPRRLANAEFLVRAVNSHDELVAALDEIFMRVSYVTIHGVGEQPEPNGDPQPIRVGKEEFWRLFQEIGTIASTALDKADGRS